MPLRFPVVPMKAAMGALPPTAQDEEWAYEIKWDGYRTLAFIADGVVRLQSSNSIDVTAKYPELAGFASAVNAASAIIDGELVALDSAGRPSFSLMQQHATEVAFYAFDVLQINDANVWCAIVRSPRHRHARTPAKRRGCAPTCGRALRSQSSPTTATSATQASSS